MFLILLGGTILDLGRDLWGNIDQGHGLLLIPVALYLAWTMRERRAHPSRKVAGLLLVGLGVGSFLAGSLAAEVYTRRLSVLLVAAGLALYYRGYEQLRAWWLPFLLLVTAIPLPEVLLGTITLPLQLLASRLAVELLEFRHVPAVLAGNVILLPGRELFVAEACSGLRYLTAHVAFALLLAGTTLKPPSARMALVLAALPAALLANAMRVFLTGYLALYAGWDAAPGTLHTALGVGVFGLSLAGILGVGLVLRRLER